MPAVTRVGDADVTHCSGMTRAVGSPNVRANSIAIEEKTVNEEEIKQIYFDNNYKEEVV